MSFFLNLTKFNNNELLKQKVHKTWYDRKRKEWLLDVKIRRAFLLSICQIFTSIAGSSIYIDAREYGRWFHDHTPQESKLFKIFRNM